jgi:hypothetical protein
MSTIANCPGCESGRHDQHVGSWDAKPGLIGGAECDCSGDCAERVAEAQKRMWSAWDATTPESSPR